MSFGGSEQRQLGHQLPAEGHIAARDVRMHIDGAGHDDLARDVMNFVGLASVRLFDDAPVFQVEISDGIAIVRGIDDTAALKLYEHQAAPFASISASIRLSTSATVGLFELAAVALTMPMPAIWGR